MNRFFRLYYDGFRTMPRWGRIVWTVIIVKLVIMFGVLKVFFFSDTLNTRYETDEQRSEAVIQDLVDTAAETTVETQTDTYNIQ